MEVTPVVQTLTNASRGLVIINNVWVNTPGTSEKNVFTTIIFIHLTWDVLLTRLFLKRMEKKLLFRAAYNFVAQTSELCLNFMNKNLFLHFYEMIGLIFNIHITIFSVELFICRN